LNDAREAARKHAATVVKGGNPSVERRVRGTASTVLTVIESYLCHARTRQRGRSYKETERHLRRQAAPLHHERVETVRRRDISELLENIKEKAGPVTANFARRPQRFVGLGFAYRAN
jgi:hypothetical protein